MIELICNLAGDVEFILVAYRPLNRGPTANKGTIRSGPFVGKPIAGRTGRYSRDVVDFDHGIGSGQAAEFEICTSPRLGRGLAFGTSCQDYQGNQAKYGKGFSHLRRILRIQIYIFTFISLCILYKFIYGS